ncbi:MAG: hypothetical protein ACM31C_11870 [Acidobacteriota bacterium]
MRGLIVAAALAACSRAPAAEHGTADDLAAYLRTVAGADRATREHEVASWQLGEQAWNRTVVEPFRGLYTDYARGFDAATAPLAAQLAARGTITARRHFADDPRLTLAQGRLRWTVPVMYPSAVAELAGAPIDTVFVFDGDRWRALAGVDALVLARARALDAGCGELLARAGRDDRCSQVGWVIADAALRGERARFDHACTLAVGLCGKPSR